MSEYGVQTNNLFDLLIAADETLKAAAKAKAEKAKAKSKPKKAAKPSASQKPTQAPKKKIVHLTTDVPAICPPTQRMPKTAAPLGDQIEKKEPEKQEEAAPVAEGGKKAGKPQKKGGDKAQSPKQGGSAAPNAAAAKEPGTGGKAPRGGQRGGARQQGDKKAETKPEDSLASSGQTEGFPAVKKPSGPREKGDRKPPGGFTRNREFDRRPGTGRPATENKKGGAGPGNWGKVGEAEVRAEADVKEELKAEAAEGEANAAAAKKKNRKKKKGAKGEEEEENKEKKDEIPDEQLKLFDDFMKTQKKPKVSLPAVRKPEESDPSWASATKVERTKEDLFFLAPPKDEKKKVKEAPKADQKPSKSKLKRLREKKKREEERKKTEQDNIKSLFDFTVKKEPETGFGGPRRNQGPRGGKGRDGGDRRPRRFDDDAPRPSGDRPQGGFGRGGAPRKFGVSVDAPQFDDSSFPALQVGPPTVTSSE